MMKTIFSLLFILILVSNAEAYEKKEINLPSGTDLIYTGFEEGNSTLIIWLPSEHGTSPEMIESALNIAVEGFDVWTLDLHSTYMEPPGRASMAKFDAEEIYQILAVAKKRGYENIVLSAASRINRTNRCVLNRCNTHVDTACRTGRAVRAGRRHAQREVGVGVSCRSNRQLTPTPTSR